ncbi:MAG: NAD-dependent epimerase/dehydratase family protein [Chloroflexota bacterium]
MLVTGGCGFIGANLCPYLGERGYQVRVLDNLSVGKRENLDPAAELLVGDVRDGETVARAVRGVDAVVHLAAHTSVVESLEKPLEDWDVNVNGTLNLLEACRREGVDRFVLASSNAVVGEQPPPISESLTPRPLSPYGAAKLAGEALGSSYHHSFGLKTVSLRFANVYGPRAGHKSSVIAIFIRRAKAGQPLTVYGDGQQTRDFVHADDICQAIHLALTAAGADFGGVFQIGTGVETSINRLTGLLRELTGQQLQIDYRPARPGEIRRNYSDISKARAILGFAPAVSLEEGLRRLLSV